MVKIEIGDKTALEIRFVLEDAEKEIRKRKSPLSGMTTAATYDRLRAIEDGLKALRDPDNIIEDAELG